MCWTVADKEGLSLSQVYYQAPGGTYRRVLGAASLSQIQAVFDDGAAVDPMFINTSLGLGGNNAQTLNQQTCHNGKLHAENGRNVLCARTLPKGYQRQAETFELSSYSQIGPRNYQLRWTFYENGTIEPAVGLSGILPAVGQSAEHYGWPTMRNGQIATGFTDHYLWRLDFDLADDADNDSVQEIRSIPSTSRLTKKKITSGIDVETARLLNPEHKTFWRILDQNLTASGSGVGAISYEIVPGHYDQSAANSLNQSWLAHDIYFSRYHECERHAAHNPADDCAANTDEFIADQENIAKSDIVVWYKLTHHHLPSSEDSNRIATRWSSFQLLPRDWHSQNPY